jgi:hypothetical protein
MELSKEELNRLEALSKAGGSQSDPERIAAVDQIMAGMMQAANLGVDARMAGQNADQNRAAQQQIDRAANQAVANRAAAAPQAQAAQADRAAQQQAAGPGGHEAAGRAANGGGREAGGREAAGREAGGREAGARESAAERNNVHDRGGATPDRIKKRLATLESQEPSEQSLEELIEARRSLL